MIKSLDKLLTPQSLIIFGVFAFIAIMFFLVRFLRIKTPTISSTRIPFVNSDTSVPVSADTATIQSTETTDADVKVDGKKGKKVKVPEGKFAAMVFTYEGIKFPKIDVVSGNPIILDPTMPKHGAHYLAIEKKETKVVKVDGEDKEEVKITYQHYDPRQAPFEAEFTPTVAYYAIDGSRLYKAVWQNKYDAWDKLNLLLAGVGMVGFFLVILSIIDKIGK
jgi:hypothetical protein